MIVKSTYGRQVRGSPSRSARPFPTSLQRHYHLEATYQFSPPLTYIWVWIEDTYCPGRTHCGDNWYYTFYFDSVEQAQAAADNQPSSGDVLNYYWRKFWNYERTG